MSLDKGNNISTDKHSSYKEAVHVCEQLKLRGFGLRGKEFPLRAFVLKDQDKFTKEEVDEIFSVLQYGEKIYLNQLFSKNDYMTMDQLVWFILTKTNGEYDEAGK